MMDNDKTIFEWLKPQNNDMFSMFNNDDIDDILCCLNKYYLEYRDILNIDSNVTFGIEIEIDKFVLGVEGHWPFYVELNSLLNGNNWDVRNDITLKNGREIVSDVLRDCYITWNDIRNICSFVSQYGEIDNTCAAHVHVGSQVLGNVPLYWYRLFKLWSIYENVIYRFCYGEYLTHREHILDYAKPTAMFFKERLPIVENRLHSCSLIEMLHILKPQEMLVDMLKKFGISYWHMLADDEYNLFEDFNVYNYGCTVEYRVPNGTYNEIIWQNLVLFFIKLMEYCKSDKFDDDLLERRNILLCENSYDIWDYSKIYLGQALELCDMIYNNNIDKIYFLRQYLKSFEVSNKAFVKTKKFTM